MRTRPRLFVTRRLPEAVEVRLARDYAVHGNEGDVVLGSAELLAGAAAADAILTCATETWTAAVIDALPASVGMLATFSAGFEHVDIGACERRGIIVSNTPDVLTEATADVTLLCLLAASRRAHESQALLRRGAWGRWTPTELLGRGLQGRNLGIVGMGRIGRAVATRARTFGLTIHYHNRARLVPALEQGATYHETLESLLPQAHFLSVNCPASAENRNMINESRLRLLPEGAVLVNTARGTLVDDAALIDALRSGRLFAAGLDVFAGEPRLHPGYLDLPNAYLLPHIGSATVETRNAMGFRCLDNLDAFFAGRPVPDAVTGSRGG